MSEVSKGEIPLEKGKEIKADLGFDNSQTNLGATKFKHTNIQHKKHATEPNGYCPTRAAIRPNPTSPHDNLPISVTAITLYSMPSM